MAQELKELRNKLEQQEESAEKQKKKYEKEISDYQDKLKVIKFIFINYIYVYINNNYLQEANVLKERSDKKTKEKMENDGSYHAFLKLFELAKYVNAELGAKHEEIKNLQKQSKSSKTNRKHKEILQVLKYLGQIRHCATKGGSMVRS